MAPEITLCPSACSAVTGSGTIEIVLGCETIDIDVLQRAVPNTARFTQDV